ncbi:30S ribosomal protein S15 [Candidatus Bathyarchaeota archaeon]|nr:MAG: 30S ribosomal protein S15 [Candidatus Bathyarchaeota archaeon]
MVPKDKKGSLNKAFKYDHHRFRESSGGCRVPKKEKGKSHSTRPVTHRKPSWCKYTPEEVEALVVKLAKEGNFPSKIGVILRDQYGIPLVKPLVGKSITEILKEYSLAPSIPEDLEMLLRKASRLHAHLEKHKGDKHNKRALQIIESKIHRLSGYYKRKGVLPKDWKYTPTVLAIR